MKVEVDTVKERGDLNNERVILKVNTDTDIGRFLLGVTRCTGERQVSSNLNQIYWFPDKAVKRGDFVVLFTKKGTRGQYENQTNSITHTFYLNLDACIWDLQKAAAVIFEIGMWQSSRISD